MYKFKNVILATVVCLCSVAAIADEILAFPSIQIHVNHRAYSLEYADTFELRAQGLMHRKAMCENCGMLFNFKRIRVAGMWMKNTLIPLDVAFIRQDGEITDIKDMQPHDLKTTRSSEGVLYAWEMNQGWFKKNDIKVGDTVYINSANIKGAK